MYIAFLSQGQCKATTHSQRGPHSCLKQQVHRQRRRPAPVWEDNHLTKHRVVLGICIFSRFLYVFPNVSSHSDIVKFSSAQILLVGVFPEASKLPTPSREGKWRFQSKEETISAPQTI